MQDWDQSIMNPLVKLKMKKGNEETDDKGNKKGKK
tara:strand:- start:117 stop:221 length:105 start_codon:yes stop_codon:yes gene_type:complete